MASTSIEQLSEDIKHVEKLLQVQSEFLNELSGKIGETFAKQAYSVNDLMIRWNCKETLVRSIIKNHKLKLLRGANGKPRKPLVVLRTSLLEYENGLTMLPKSRRQTKPVITWADNPNLATPKLNIPLSARGVRRLGEL